ncbi:large ribosomal subunit protein bL19m-like [Babylonia areolata]|uniref:large ribosomal subunit protein bL19m-like n=1 Tax=Babylonia areolata TaxID=304850 RepID=UPI003FD2F3D4
MALLGQVARGWSSILTKFQLEAAASALSVPVRSYRSPHDTKARRARELRPRRNYMLEEEVEQHRKSLRDRNEAATDEVEVPKDFRHVMPEFLPTTNPLHRDRIREKLERMDMFARRACIDIPEFYVGSIMAVTMADQHAPGKQNRFVGICIQRGGVGLRAHFTLRNVIDGQGVEIRFDMYSSSLHKIEVLKLEKRLDEELFYLRDAPAEYSTVPLDFEPVPLPKSASVPVNPIKVKLNPRPWLERWERYDLKGVQDLGLPERFYRRAEEVAKPWEKYDIMKHHRESVDELEVEAVMKEAYSQTLSTRRARGKQKASLKKK